MVAAWLGSALAATGNAAAQPDPVFYASFDSGFEATMRDDSRLSADKSGFPRLVPGRFGNALLAGPKSGSVSYPARGVIDRRQGTVEMWVAPVDWDGFDGKFHVFFQMRDVGALYLYKYLDSPRLLMLGTDDAEQGPYHFSARDADWAPRQWRHIAGTWSEDGVLAYVDGVAQTDEPIAAVLPQSTGGQFQIGDLTWSTLRLSSSVIDEVRIYDRALTPAQVRQAFLGRRQVASGKAVRSAELRYSVEDFGATLVARVTASTAVTADARTTAVFSIGSRDRQRLVSAPVHLANGQASAKLRIADLAPGDYDLTVTFSRDDTGLVPQTVSVRVPDPAASNEAAGDRFRFARGLELVNGRARGAHHEYEYRNSLFPRQITAAGAPLLAAPIEIYLGVASSVTERAAAAGLVQTAQLTKGGQEAVVVSRFDSASIEGGRAKVMVRTTFEPDGMAWFDTTITPLGPAELEGPIEIRIPVRPSVAQFRHRWDTERPVSGRLAGGRGRVDRAGFVPFYWLGNDDRGLFWFAETSRSWPNALGDDAVEIVRGANVVNLVIRVKRAGSPSQKEVRFSFGLQGTPIKSLPKSWRSWRLDPAHDASHRVIWPEPNTDSFKFYGYPEPASPAAFSASLGAYRNRGLKPMPYVCPTCVATNTPEWGFSRKWWSLGVIDTPPDVSAYRSAVAMLAPGGRGWAPFISKKTGSFMRDYRIDALYLDNTAILGGYAPDAGLGYTRDGKRMREFPILAYRELFKSIRAEVDASSSEALVVAHTSGSIGIPALSFFDVYLNGEQFRGRVKDNYLDVTTLDAFRAEFSGRQWGLAPMFLPEFDDRHARMVQPTRGLMALLMLHDIGVWPQWCNVEEANRATRSLSAFGYEHAVFVPYFHDDPPARAEDRDVLVSGYRRDDDWLLVVGNTAATPARTVVCPSASRDLRGRKWSSFVTRAPVSANDQGCFPVNLDGLDYALVVSQPRLAAN